MLCQKGLPDRHKHFTHFLHSTIMHVAGRAYQIRSRPNPDNAPIDAGKLRKQAAKAGIQLFKSLQALGPEDRGAFFDMIAAYCRKFDFIELDDHDPSLDYLRELSSAFPLETLGPTCEFLLALLVRQQSVIPDHQPQLVNLEPEFVKTAAEYWEQPPVSLPLTRSTNSGSFDHFCMTVSKTFGFDLDPQQVTNGIKMLFEERKRPPKSPDERIYAHMKELDAQAQATLQELAEGLTGSDVARRR